MSGPITNISSLPPQVQQYADDLLLARKMPYTIHSKLAMMKMHPQSSGNIHRFRRYNNLPTVPNPVGASGLTGPALPLSALDVDAQIQWYNGYVILTDQVTLISQEDVLSETVSLLAQSLRETEDQLIRDTLLSSASFYNCVGGVNGDSPTEITATDISTVVRTLLTNSARTVADVIEGKDKFGTSPVRRSYFCLSHTNISSNLEQVDGFIPVSNYPDQNGITLESEWGSVRNCRFLLSPLGSTTANGSVLGSTIYNNFVVGMESYAAIFLEGATAQFIYKPLGWGNDPTNLRQTAGFKFAQAQRLLNDAWLINMRSTLA
jgi:N4-gp56 family major capsid protein